MGSKKTTLIVSNLRKNDIKNIMTTASSNSDWDGDSRPDRNFNQVGITRINARGKREELNDPFVGSLKNGIFDMKIEYEDNKKIDIRNCHQKDALTKYRRVIAKNGDIEVFQSSGAGSNALEVRDVIPPDNSNWMKQLLERSPEIQLHNICMPGSHDAGMYVVRETWKCSNEAVQTQDQSFLNQLKSGSRYFDVRIWFNNKDFYTYHGDDNVGMFFGGEGGRLKDILNDVNTFIDQFGRNEGIILKFSHTYSNVDKKELVDFILANTKNVYISLDDNIEIAKLTLRELSGKILLVFDSEFKDQYNSAKGVIAYYDYSDHVKNNGLTVYDKYASTKDYEEMKDDQLKKLDKYALNDSYLFLLSWTLTGGFGLLDIGVLSSLCRPWLPEYIHKMKHSDIKKPNIIYIDFIDPWIGQAIISLND